MPRHSHKLTPRDPDFKEGRRPMEHRCAWEGEEQNCTNLYEVIKKEELKYMDEEEKEYSNLMSFRNNNTNNQTKKNKKLNMTEHHQKKTREKRNK